MKVRLQERCATPGCRNFRLWDRKICAKCKQRKWREAHPDKAAYHNLRNHAKARGIEWGLTFDEFQQIISGTEYLSKRGNKKDNLHIDRINPLRGYVPGNVRVVTCSENTIKGNKERSTDEYVMNRWKNLNDPFTPDYEVGDADEFDLPDLLPSDDANPF